MKCASARELLSAAADGELRPSEQRALDEHTAGCATCRSYAERLGSLDRIVRVRPAEAVPDLVPAVVARARPARLGRGGWLRPALAWTAIVLLAQSIPGLATGNFAGADTHVARHLGAFGVALAIGLLYVAWKPHRAFGLLPFTAALVGTMIAAAAFDVVDGGSTALAELVHVTELVGLTLLWMIAGSPGWPLRFDEWRARARVSVDRRRSSSAAVPRAARLVRTPPTTN
ncbi:MAG: zf-HC2 domain-containing protein [Actinomycetota bacterium]